MGFNKINSLESLGKIFRQIVKDFPAHAEYKRFYTTPRHDGSPHIELVQGQFHYVVTERGEEYERRIAESPEDILYWLISSVTFDVAIKYELENRIEGRDGRRMFFPYQEELMSKIRPEWGERLQQEHIQILKQHPFEDGI